jgi:hypothetical protein
MQLSIAHNTTTKRKAQKELGVDNTDEPRNKANLNISTISQLNPPRNQVHNNIGREKDTEDQFNTIEHVDLGMILEST